VTTSLLAAFTVPFGMHFLSGLLGIETSITSTRIASRIVTTFLAPLGAGMLVHAVTREELSARIGDHLLRVAGVILVAVALALLVHSVRSVVALGLTPLGVFAAFTLVALASGHVLGGSNPSDRTSLAVACASRHIGIALLVASDYPSERALALIAAYLLASVLVSVPYVRWRRKVLGGVPARAPTA
jgi:BASS family bile acid:Na+ symporter